MAVQADVEHLVGVVEDFLRAVAVVEVDIEHGDTTVPFERVGSHCRVVDIAVTSVLVTPRVMPRRAL